jgi:hypothetical protein
MNTEPGNNILFREIQYFRQRWVLLLLMAAAGFSWYNFLTSILLKNSLINDPIPVWVSVLLWLLFGLLIPYLLYTANLATVVYPEGLQINFRPFSNQFFKFSDIKSVSTIEEIHPENRSFLDIHTGRGMPQIFNINGKDFIEISLKNGDKMLLGSQDTNGLAKAINRQLKM